MTIGEIIKAARKKNGLTQKELAEKLGLATGTIQQYELGKRQPRIEQAAKIFSVLGLSIYSAFGDNFDENIKQSEFEYKDKSGNIKIANANDVYKSLPSISKEEFWFKVLLKDGYDPKSRILFALNLLSEDGIEEAAKRVEELTEIPKYQRQPEEGEESAVDPQEND